ncbi:MAG: hypothetical protein IT258_19695, partial [Saprospiraceae bacterium]|nr:hypothetical protein [Saprospiraceae bacterium]
MHTLIPKANACSTVLTLLLLVVFLTSCTSDNKAIRTKNQIRFFDLKGYFDGEIKRLGNSGIATKLVVVGGLNESKKDSVDFKRELGLFAISDINRPAWSDKYACDSTFMDGNLVSLNIKALDEKLKTQQIEIGFKDGLVSRIEIKNNSSNSITTSSQVLVYEPSIGYTVESQQKVAMSDAAL